MGNLEINSNKAFCGDQSHTFHAETHAREWIRAQMNLCGLKRWRKIICKTFFFPVKSEIFFVWIAERCKETKGQNLVALLLLPLFISAYRSWKNDTCSWSEQKPHGPHCWFMWLTSPRTKGSELQQEQLSKHTSWLMWTNWIRRWPSHHLLTQAWDQFMHQTVCLSALNLLKVWTSRPWMHIIWRLRIVWFVF